MKLAACLSTTPDPALETRTPAPASASAPAWRRAAWTLSDWLDHARQIEGRRPSRHRYAAADRHLALFPADLIGVELDRPTLREVRGFLAAANSNLFSRPARGFRADAPQTPWIVALDNQLARLDRIRGRNAPDEP